MMFLLVYLWAVLDVIVSAFELRRGAPSQRGAALTGAAGLRRNAFHVCSSPFDEAELDAMNPPAPPPPPREPAQYVRDDALSKYRFANFDATDQGVRHIAALPYAEVRHQDKGALIPYRSVEEVVACYSNKLTTLLSNFREWTAAFNPRRDDLVDLSLYNPLSSGSYYAVVFYCAWQSESQALKRAVHQLAGRYSFERDPPVVHGPKPRERLEDLLAKLDEVKRRHEELVAEARAKGLPDPPRPPLEEREKVTMTMRSVNAAETCSILERMHGRYNYRWWMPHVGTLKFNKVFCRAYNELYNTSYKMVRSDRSRLKYKLSDTGRRPVESAAPHEGAAHSRQHGPLTRINFILVRLANSVMLSNSRRGLQRMRSAAHGHEKEMHFNEIVMRLLIDSGILYKDMPAIRLFKCVNPVESVPPVFARKSVKALPFAPSTPFYRPDPFDIAARTLYGLPPLRKCSHLSVASDFAYVGGIAGLADLPDPPALERLVEGGEDAQPGDFRRLLVFNAAGDTAESAGVSPADVDRLEPFLATLELMYKLNLRQIIDARPVPVVYGLGRRELREPGQVEHGEDAPVVAALQRRGAERRHDGQLAHVSQQQVLEHAEDDELVLAPERLRQAVVRELGDGQQQVAHGVLALEERAGGRLGRVADAQGAVVRAVELLPHQVEGVAENAHRVVGEELGARVEAVDEPAGVGGREDVLAEQRLDDELELLGVALERVARQREHLAGQRVLEGALRLAREEAGENLAVQLDEPQEVREGLAAEDEQRLPEDEHEVVPEPEPGVLRGALRIGRLGGLCGLSGVGGLARIGHLDVRELLLGEEVGGHRLERRLADEVVDEPDDALVPQLVLLSGELAEVQQVQEELVLLRLAAQRVLEVRRGGEHGGPDAVLERLRGEDEQPVHVDEPRYLVEETLVEVDGRRVARFEHDAEEQLVLLTNLLLYNVLTFWDLRLLDLHAELLGLEAAAARLRCRGRLAHLAKLDAEPVGAGSEQVGDHGRLQAPDVLRELRVETQEDRLDARLHAAHVLHHQHGEHGEAPAVDGGEHEVEEHLHDGVLGVLVVEGDQEELVGAEAGVLLEGLDGVEHVLLEEPPVVDGDLVDPRAVRGEGEGQEGHWLEGRELVRFGVQEALEDLLGDGGHLLGDERLLGDLEDVLRHTLALVEAVGGGVGPLVLQERLETADAALEPLAEVVYLLLVLAELVAAEPGKAGHDDVHEVVCGNGGVGGLLLGSENRLLELLGQVEERGDDLEDLTGGDARAVGADQEAQSVDGGDAVASGDAEAQVVQHALHDLLSQVGVFFGSKDAQHAGVGGGLDREGLHRSLEGGDGGFAGVVDICNDLHQRQDVLLCGVELVQHGDDLCVPALGAGDLGVPVVIRGARGAVEVAETHVATSYIAAVGVPPTEVPSLAVERLVQTPVLGPVGPIAPVPLPTAFAGAVAIS
ncbi:uncharacterized protein BcabD6B2_33590 [Babesia caballi]|uniref:Membrane protein, putative n=1 Tax=Babesia caballi TaxID=5871 RepID=A0AAV4LV48_BABCB|nr:membrane protein, putative [Babesia caballi]